MPSSVDAALWAIAIGAILALPVALLGRKGKRRAQAAGAAPGVTVPAPEHWQRRIAELEDLLAAEKRHNRILADNKALWMELCHKREQLIERLSPGLLAGTERRDPDRTRQAAE